MKTLLEICSEHESNDFAFIPHGLHQMTTNAAFRRQILLHNNFLTTIAVVAIHEIPKKVMKEKVAIKLLKILGIKFLEETH